MLVSDDVIWSLHVKIFMQMLDKQNIKFKLFTDVKPNPSLATCIKDVKILESFKSDVIILWTP